LPISSATPEIEVVQKVSAQLGETPLWCERTGRLWWIDIEAPRLFALDPATSDSWTFPQSGTFLGCHALTRSGRHLLARDLDILTADESLGDEKPFARTPDERLPDTRLNDGRVDALGRLWVGSMDNELHRRLGGLYRVDPDGVMTRMAVRSTVDARHVFFRQSLALHLDCCEGLFDVPKVWIGAQK